MSVSLDQVIAAAGRRLAPLTAECAGHAVLAVADQVVQAPSLVEASLLSLEENGAIRIARGVPSDEQSSERRLRELLDQLMRVARGGGGALFRAAMRESAGDLPRFVRELEAALIPANRAAARRSLARLHRETLRALECGSLDVAPPAAPAAPTVSPAAERSEPAEPSAPATSPAVTSTEHASPAVPSAEPRALGVPDPTVEVPELPKAEALESAAPAAIEAPSVPEPEEPTPSPRGAQDADEPLLEIDVHVSPEPPPIEPLPTSDLAMQELASSPTPEAEDNATPLEPVIQRVRQRESLLPPVEDGHTPYLGTRVALLAPPPLPRLPRATGVTSGDDGTTDRMPPVEWSDEEPEVDDEALTPYLDQASARVAPQDVEPDGPRYPGPGYTAILPRVAPVETPDRGAAADEAEPTRVGTEVGARPVDESESTTQRSDPSEPGGDVAANGPKLDSASESANAGNPADADEFDASELPPGVAARTSKRLVPVMATPAPPRYTRKSDVSELVKNFSVAQPEPSRTLLRGLKSLAGLDTSETPPPVAVAIEGDESNQGETQEERQRSIRPIATVTVLGAVLSMAAFAGPRVGNAQPVTEPAAVPALAAATRPPTCQASIQVVGAKSNARIEVRPQSSKASVEPQWATGPEALFSQLPCATAFEVLVRSGVDKKRDWTRVPISAAELSPAQPETGRVHLEVDVTRAGATTPKLESPSGPSGQVSKRP